MTQRDLLIMELRQLFADYSFIDTTSEDIINLIVNKIYEKKERPTNWPPIEYDQYLATLFVSRIPSEGG